MGMATKRMNKWIVNMRWKLPNGTSITKQIIEKGLTSQSAAKKVVAYYNRPAQVKKFGKPTLVTVISYYGSKWE